MPAKRLPLKNDAQISALKKEEKPFEHAIDGQRGLRVRVYPSGLKVFLYRYRNKLRTRQNKSTGADEGVLERITLGPYRSGPKLQGGDERISLKDAVARLHSERQIREQSGSPKKVRRQAIDEQKAAERAEEAQKGFEAYTLGAMLDEYMAFISDAKNKAEKRGEGFVKTHREVCRALDRYILGRKVDDTTSLIRAEIGAMPASDVRYADIKAQLAPVEDHRFQYNRCISYLKAAFNWAIRKEGRHEDRSYQPRVTVNPCVLFVKKDEESHARPLSEVEIRNFLKSLPDSGIPAKIQAILRVILLTGLRPSAAAGIRHEFIDRKRKTLTMPKELMKSGREFVVPMTRQLEVVLAMTDTKTGLLFPRGEKAYDANEIARQLRAGLKTMTKTFEFTPKELRTTLATEISQLKDAKGDKISRFLKARLLDHADSEVTGRHYDKYDYLDEKRHWLEVWAAHIAGIEEPVKAKREAA